MNKKEKKHCTADNNTVPLLSTFFNENVEEVEDTEATENRDYQIIEQLAKKVNYKHLVEFGKYCYELGGLNKLSEMQELIEKIMVPSNLKYV
jgi:hypothetical protein